MQTPLGQAVVITILFPKKVQTTLPFLFSFVTKQSVLPASLYVKRRYCLQKIVEEKLETGNVHHAKHVEPFTNVILKENRFRH